MMLATMMAVTFVGCNKDDDEKDVAKPSINMPQEINVDLSDLSALQVKVTVTSAEEDLTAIAVYVQYLQDEIIKTADLETGFVAGKGVKMWEKTYVIEDLYGLMEAFADGSNFTLNVKANTQNAETSEQAKITISGLPPEYTDLTDAAAFTLGRPEQPGYPASAMGITWASNVDDNTAKFTAAANALAMIDEATYNATTTQEALKAVFDAIPGKVSEFTAKSDANFKVQYLIVQDGATLRLVKMTGMTFKPGENQATFTEKH